MAKKYYAVKQGTVPGIYLTWADCQKQVKGFPGAVFKSFLTLEEAAAFVEQTGSPECAEARRKSQPEQEAEVIAYVDGSYRNDTKEYAFGAVIFHQGQEVRKNGMFCNPDMAVMRNVAGEIEGAKYAMRYCMETGARSLDIFYDYEGIANWCTGAWQAKKEGTKEYQKFYQNASKQVAIRFVKVKGHSGDQYNDVADSLAKAALGIG